MVGVDTGIVRLPPPITVAMAGMVGTAVTITDMSENRTDGSVSDLRQSVAALSESGRGLSVSESERNRINRLLQPDVSLSDVLPGFARARISALEKSAGGDVRTSGCQAA